MQCWTGNDIVCVSEALAAEVSDAGVPEVGFVDGDMELRSFGSGWDLIVANASFQWLCDPVGFVSALPGHLAPGGILAFSTFGPDNLAELAAVTDTGLCYAGRETMVAALSERCNVLAATESHRRMPFSSPHDILRHLRATGTNALARTRWLRRDLDSFSKRYHEQCASADGTVWLTYHPMLFIASVTATGERNPA